MEFLNRHSCDPKRSRLAAAPWPCGPQLRRDNPSYFVTSSVALKAILRVCASLAAQDWDPEDGRVRRWDERLAPWAELRRTFRADGFYERFPAKGQVERVGRIHRGLARAAGVEVAAGPKRASG
jgi:hypothetical protein